MEETSVPAVLGEAGQTEKVQDLGPSQDSRSQAPGIFVTILSPVTQI